ncbi:MAG: diaminopimelate decarboxylase [Pseudomonadota bacterium]
MVDQYFNTTEGNLLVGSVDINAITEQFGTPLFVYDAQTLERKWAALTNALPDDMDIYYSIKANPNQSILQFFLQRGLGLEIASQGELHQALQAGCPAEKVIFAGPGKTEAELVEAISQNIGEIHVESTREVELIAAIAANLQLQCNISLRINPAGEAQGGAMRMGGKPAPFGIDEESLDEAVTKVQSLNSVQLCGIHLFSGTQILDADILATQYEKALAIADNVARLTSAPIETVDFGGGLGIPYFPHEEALDVVDYGQRVGALIRDARKKPHFASTQFIVEPGRYLVGEAGIYVARVIDVKQSRGKNFVITDGGMHHHLAASGNLGQTIKRNYPVGVLNKLNSPAEETYEVVGPLCTPLDVLARQLALPKVEVGDLIGVFQSGAYGRTASPLGFLSHTTPPEVLIDSGQTHLIRERGTPEDYLRDQPI